MIRVVIDTNIVVSALLHSGSPPETVLTLAIMGDVQWLASEAILTEYVVVLSRRKLALHPVRADEAIAKIRAAVAVVKPSVSIKASSDPDDNKFLECAQAGNADYLVTGNTRHFPRTWQDTRVVTPREFIDDWTAATGASL